MGPKAIRNNHRAKYITQVEGKMGKNDWQRAEALDDLNADFVPQKRGGFFRVVAVLLLLGTAVLATAYYIPLYRAHSALTSEYRKLANEAATQRRQLTESIETLKRISAERDALATQARSQLKQGESARTQNEKLEQGLESALKKFTGKGRIEMRKQGGQVILTMAAPATIGLGTADVTEFGKKALCALARPAKTAGSKAVITGMGVVLQPKKEFSFALAATRAASIAKLLSDGCGFPPDKIEIRVAQQTDQPNLAAEIALSD